MKDISGKRFYHLTALYPTEQRDSKGFVVWHCRCDCGKEVDYSYNMIVYGNIRSCGCVRKIYQKILHEHLTHVDGTSVNLLKSKKIPQNNTTGVKGVYFIRGKYVAKIVFQKKQYILGTFNSIAEAAEARKEGEDIFCDQVVAFYERWREKANADPQWAQENPVKINVSRDHAYRLQVDCWPMV